MQHKRLCKIFTLINSREELIPINLLAIKKPTLLNLNISKNFILISFAKAK
jgi:hypothetical protein